MIALLIFLSGAHAAPLLNDRGPTGGLRGPEPSRPQLRQRSMGMNEAVAIAERRYQGRAVDARHIGNGVYRVRILQDDGKVKTVTIRGNRGRY